MYRASKYDGRVTDVEVIRTTPHYVYFGRQEAIVSDSHCYFHEKQDAINWLKNSAKRNLIEAKKRLSSCEASLKKLNELYPD